MCHIENYWHILVQPIEKDLFPVLKLSKSDYMIRKRKISKPFDFGYTIMDNEYPKILYSRLNVPGIFRKKINKKVYFKDGHMGEMDSSYIADPDFVELFEAVAVNGEHQSTPVDDEKIEMISYYGIQQIHDTNLPQYSFVASHLPQEKHVQQFKRSRTDIIQPHYLDLGEEDNKKRLNNVKNIIKKQEKITDEDALELGIITVFAPRDKGKEITEEVIELYNEIIDQLSPKMEFTLYSVLFAMTDAYFDDEHKFEDVIKMLKEKTTSETIEKFETLTTFKNKVLELEKTNNTLEKTNNTLEKTNNTLKNRNTTLEREKNSATTRISELEAEIADLKKQLSQPNHQPQY